MSITLEAIQERLKTLYNEILKEQIRVFGSNKKPMNSVLYADCHMDLIPLIREDSKWLDLWSSLILLNENPQDRLNDVLLNKIKGVIGDDFVLMSNLMGYLIFEKEVKEEMAELLKEEYTSQGIEGNLFPPILKEYLPKEIEKDDTSLV